MDFLGSSLQKTCGCRTEPAICQSFLCVVTDTYVDGLSSRVTSCGVSFPHFHRQTLIKEIKCPRLVCACKHVIETGCQPNLQFASMFARYCVASWICRRQWKLCIGSLQCLSGLGLCCESNLEMVDFPGISANIISKLLIWDLELGNILFMTRC